MVLNYIGIGNKLIMFNNVDVTIYHDVFCAWCYIAQRNFKPVIEEYRDFLNITYKVWPLYPKKSLRAPEKVKEMILLHWEEIKKFPGGEDINPELMRSRKFDFPHSLPVLAAIKCAELQGGVQAHGQYFELAQEALFVTALNLDDRVVLIELAEEAGLDMERFRIDLANGKEDDVLDDFSKAQEIGIKVIPTTFVGSEKIIGATSTEDFRITVAGQLQEKAA